MLLRIKTSSLKFLFLVFGGEGGGTCYRSRSVDNLLYVWAIVQQKKLERKEKNGVCLTPVGQRKSNNQKRENG